MQLAPGFPSAVLRAVGGAGVVDMLDLSSLWTSRPEAERAGRAAGLGSMEALYHHHNFATEASFGATTRDEES